MEHLSDYQSNERYVILLETIEECLEAIEHTKEVQSWDVSQDIYLSIFRDLRVLANELQDNMDFRQYQSDWNEA